MVKEPPRNVVLSLDDGSVYGREDSTTATGYKPEDVAVKIVQMVASRVDEKIIAPLHHRVAVWIRNFVPPLYFWIMARRASKSRADVPKHDNF